ncbi:MAG: DUF4363 family protein [Oscillospiraceae bacterium]|nr:DUF4363 family protein [Oscillospiraceae bacterium]
MKRLVTAVLILALLVGGNLYTRRLLDDTGLAMLQQVDGLEEQVGMLSTQELERACASLQHRWLTTEAAWSRFLRSDRLESITIEVSRLPALARYGQTADVAAGLCEVRVLLQEVLSFESPSFSDIF